MSFALRTKAKIVNVLEHHRTIRGRRDAQGHAFTESVNLGWFLHIDFDGDGIASTSFGVGTEKPDLKPGDEIEILFLKPERL